MISLGLWMPYGDIFGRGIVTFDNTVTTKFRERVAARAP